MQLLLHQFLNFRAHAVGRYSNIENNPPRVMRAGELYCNSHEGVVDSPICSTMRDSWFFRAQLEARTHAFLLAERTKAGIRTRGTKNVSHSLHTRPLAPSAGVRSRC